MHGKCSRRCVLTLIEVLAGIALMSTLFALMLRVAGHTLHRRGQIWKSRRSRPWTTCWPNGTRVATCS